MFLLFESSMLIVSAFALTFLAEDHLEVLGVTVCVFCVHGTLEGVEEMK